MPILTRRTVLAAVAASPVAGVGGDSGDPMLAFWREWCAALEGAEGAGEDRRRIERGMVERIGYPRVLVTRGNGGRADAYAVTSAAWWTRSRGRWIGRSGRLG